MNALRGGLKNIYLPVFYVKEEYYAMMIISNYGINEPVTEANSGHLVVRE